MSSVEGSSSSGEAFDITSTLYIGNLHSFVQQSSLEDLCAYFGPVDAVKVIKDKGSGTSAGYGFVKFTDRASAEAALMALNFKSYLGQELRVNWALPNNHKEDTSHHCHIFVGDLGCEVTDAILYRTFCAVDQCSDARVMWDHITSRSKGYGFVSFRSKESAKAAIEQMQGQLIGTRRIRVGWAQHKQEELYLTQDVSAIDRTDPSNTNVYLGNVSPETTDLDLTNYFAVYGPIKEIKLHKKGGYGFVKYEQHNSAVSAIVGSRGRELHGRVLRCAWGKNLNPVAHSAGCGNLATAMKGLPHLPNVQGRVPLAPMPLAPNSMMRLAPNPMTAESLAASLSDMSLRGLLYPGVPQVGAVPRGLLNQLGGNPLMYHQPNMSQMLPMALATQMVMQGLQSQQNAFDLQNWGAFNSPVLTAGNMSFDAGFSGVGGSMFGGNSNMVRYS